LEHYKELASTSSVVSGRQVQQKRIRRLLRHIDRPSAGNMAAWEEAYRRWAPQITVIAKVTSESALAESKETRSGKMPLNCSSLIGFIFQVGRSSKSLTKRTKFATSDCQHWTTRASGKITLVSCVLSVAFALRCRMLHPKDTVPGRPPQIHHQHSAKRL